MAHVQLWLARSACTRARALEGACSHLCLAPCVGPGLHGRARGRLSSGRTCLARRRSARWLPSRVLRVPGALRSPGGQATRATCIRTRESATSTQRCASQRRARSVHAQADARAICSLRRRFWPAVSRQSGSLAELTWPPFPLRSSEMHISGRQSSAHYTAHFMQGDMRREGLLGRKSGKKWPFPDVMMTVPAMTCGPAGATPPVDESPLPPQHV